MRAFVATALAVLLLSGCERLPEAIAGCTPVGQLSPVCGFSRPEDLELLPDGRTLVISQMGSLDGAMPGSLVLFDTRGETITRLPQFTSAPGEHWGSSECDTPPGAAFSPHGIDLSTRADGRIQLLAVNHGGRESVEIFEVATGTAGYQLEWRGCVIAPEDAYLNDVVALPAGGMLMTYMYPRNSLQIGPFSVDLLKAVLGFNTGYVLRWDSSGFAKVGGTDAPYPNGIQLSPDGDFIYLNAYLAGEVRKIAYPGGELVAKAIVKGPDNGQWDAEGRLLVASHTGGLRDIASCFEIREGACPAGFEIVAVDPLSMEKELIFRHRGAPMGAATVAQQVGDRLYLGSFVGDRILRVPLKEGAR